MQDDQSMCDHEVLTDKDVENLPLYSWYEKCPFCLKWKLLTKEEVSQVEEYLKSNSHSH